MGFYLGGLLLPTKKNVLAFNIFVLHLGGGRAHCLWITGFIWVTWNDWPLNFDLFFKAIYCCFSSVSKESSCNAGDLGSIPGSGRSSGEGNGAPLQYSCLENPMDRGAWWATVHGVAESVMTERLNPRLCCFAVERAHEGSTTLPTVTLMSEPLSSLLSFKLKWKEVHTRLYIFV